MRVQCRHCLDPACAAACPVGALYTTESGAVAYDADICMGCRYCMVACPFRMTRYEWDSPMPRVRKCILCHDALKSGELDQPACTAACPTKATIFGERDALLAEARRRIEAAPDKYIHHIWGEHEVGGTSVLYISDVELTAAGWPEQAARPRRARAGDRRPQHRARHLPDRRRGHGRRPLDHRRRDKLAAEAAAQAPPKPDAAASPDDEVSS